MLLSLTSKQEPLHMVGLTALVLISNEGHSSCLSKFSLRHLRSSWLVNVSSISFFVCFFNWSPVFRHGVTFSAYFSAIKKISFLRMGWLSRLRVVALQAQGPKFKSSALT